MFEILAFFRDLMLFILLVIASISVILVGGVIYLAFAGLDKGFSLITGRR